MLLAHQQRHEARAHALAGQLLHAARRQFRAEPGLQRGSRGLAEVADDGLPLLASGLLQHDAVQLRQGLEVVQHLSVQREPHQHPAHRRGRAHLHGHHLIDLVALHRQRRALIALDELVQRLAERGRTVARGGNQVLLVVEISDDRGADALALVDEGILDGLDRAGLGQRQADRAAKPVVLGQQLGRVVQLAGTLVEQPAQHALAGLQLRGQRVLGVVGDAGVDGAEADDLNDQQQRQEEGDDAPFEAAQIQPVWPAHRGFSRLLSARSCRRRSAHRA